MTTLRSTTMAIAMMSLLVAVGCRTESLADTPKFPDLSGYTPVNVQTTQ